MGISRIKSLIFAARQLYGGYKIQLIILVVLGFLSGFMEALGIGVLVPIFSFAVNKGRMGEDFISQSILKFFSYFDATLNIYYLVGFMVALFLTKALVSIIFNYVNVLITSDYEKRIRQSVYKNALSASWSYLLTQKVGYLERMLFTNVSFVSRLFQQIANNVLGFTSFLMYAFVAIKLSPYVAMTTMLMGAVLIFILKPLFVRTKIYAEKRKKAEESINHHINENIVGIKTVKAAGVEKKVREVADEFFEKLREMRIRLNIYKVFGSSFIQPLGLIFTSTVFLVFFQRPDFDFAVFVAVMYLIQRIFGYIEKIQGSLYVVSEATPYVNGLLHFQEELAFHKEVDNGANDFSFEKELEVKDLKFEYIQERAVLSGVSFRIKKGEMVGMIGPSGAGKTTLVDILLGLFRPQSGEITLDGKSVDGISLHSWRQSVGYVSQDIFLKNDTIKGNIAFYDDKISQNDIERGAKFANIYDFIKTLPKGFDTVVGERGVMLSAGQRQRIVLARALVRKPKILILDEATSALDNESEKLIKESIDSFKGELTVIVIAHRLSTIMSADKLIAIEDGKVIEEGAPQDLLKDKSSYFYKVYDIVD